MEPGFLPLDDTVYREKVVEAVRWTCLVNKGRVEEKFGKDEKVARSKQEVDFDILFVEVLVEKLSLGKDTLASIFKGTSLGPLLEKVYKTSFMADAGIAFMKINRDLLDPTQAPIPAFKLQKDINLGTRVYEGVVKCCLIVLIGITRTEDVRLKLPSKVDFAGGIHYGIEQCTRLVKLVHEINALWKTCPAKP